MTQAVVCWCIDLNTANIRGAAILCLTSIVKEARHVPDMLDQLTQQRLSTHNGTPVYSSDVDIASL